MTIVKVLLVIWGVSLTASWWLYGSEVETRADRLIVWAATLTGLVAIGLAVAL